MVTPHEKLIGYVDEVHCKGKVTETMPDPKLKSDRVKAIVIPILNELILVAIRMNLFD